VEEKIVQDILYWFKSKDIRLVINLSKKELTKH